MLHTLALVEKLLSYGTEKLKTNEMLRVSKMIRPGMFPAGVPAPGGCMVSLFGTASTSLPEDHLPLPVSGPKSQSCRREIHHTTAADVDGRLLLSSVGSWVCVSDYIGIKKC